VAEPEKQSSVKAAKNKPDHPTYGAFTLAYEVGGIFGELALITNQPRATTVVAESDVTCYCISQEAFTRIVDLKTLFSSNIELFKDYSESALAQSRVEADVADGPKEEVTPEESEMEQTRIAAFKAQSKRGRRGTVFVAAEAPVQNFVPPVHEKSAEQSSKLLELLNGAKLLKYLDSSSKLTVVQALFSKSVPAGTDVIKQGDEGSLFYILESGSADVFIKKTVDEDAVKVTEYSAGAVFGELALMYGEPRAATVSTTSDCQLWCLDRTTFKNIMMKQNNEQYSVVKFLDKLPILKPLSSYERTRFAEALTEVSFSPGQAVIKQGEQGDCCYIVKSGTLVCYKK
jgi:cAMP-dependent protein kinase regulator